MSRDGQQRPRLDATTVGRAERVARRAGADVEQVEDAITVAVRYLALGLGEPLPCPQCGTRLAEIDHGEFRCPSDRCDLGGQRMTWQRAVVGPEVAADLADPRRDAGDEAAGASRPTSVGARDMEW